MSTESHVKQLSDLRIGQPNLDFFVLVQQNNIKKITDYLDSALENGESIVKLVKGPFGSGKTSTLHILKNFYAERGVIVVSSVMAAGHGQSVRHFISGIIRDTLRELAVVPQCHLEVGQQQSRFFSAFSSCWENLEIEHRMALADALMAFILNDRISGLREIMGEWYFPLSGYYSMNNDALYQFFTEFARLTQRSGYSVVMLLDEVESIATYNDTKKGQILDAFRHLVDSSRYYRGLFFFGTPSLVNTLDHYPALYDRLVSRIPSLRSSTWDAEKMYAVNTNMLTDALMLLYESAEKPRFNKGFSDEIRASLHNASALDALPMRDRIRTILGLLDIAQDSPEAFRAYYVQIFPADNPTDITQDTLDDRDELRRLFKKDGEDNEVYDEECVEEYDEIAIQQSLDSLEKVTEPPTTRYPVVGKATSTRFLSAKASKDSPKKTTLLHVLANEITSYMDDGAHVVLVPAASKAQYLAEHAYSSRESKTVRINISPDGLTETDRRIIDHAAHYFYDDFHAQLFSFLVGGAAPEESGARGTDLVGFDGKPVSYTSQRDETNRYRACLVYTWLAGCFCDHSSVAEVNAMLADGCRAVLDASLKRDGKRLGQYRNGAIFTKQSGRFSLLSGRKVRLGIFNKAED